MDNADAKSPEGDRRASRRLSATRSLQGDQDDAYLQAMTVQDGFRPTLADISSSQGNSPRSSYLTGDSESPPSTPRNRITAATSSPSRPSSITKAPGPDSDSFLLQNDGPASSKPAAEATIPLPQHSASFVPASSSTSATTPLMLPLRQEGPYQGPSGPSHPYQMYAQDVRIARTLSVRTSSTAEQPYSGPRGPAHPYGMYSQNTVFQPQQPAVNAVVDAAVGFPGGATDAYRRRLGPDGEEIGGLVGPDGHTEELPPYTRYPDEQIARKVRDVEAAHSPQAVVQLQNVRPTASTSQQAASAATQPEPIPGAGGIGIAARNPEFDSIDDLSAPRSRHSSRSFTSESHHEINTAAAAVVSEKEPTRWEKSGRKRVCGIFPCWVVVLAITALLVVGLILGAVLGSVLGKRVKGPQGPAAPNPFYDAIPIPLPPGLPDLPLGSFGMPLVPQRSPNVCFKDTTLAQSWTCNIAFGPAIAMVMNVGGGESGKPYSISMSLNESLSLGGSYSYGTQPPLLPTGTYAMQTVNDTLEPTRGPAWFKMMAFNKTVIVPESILSATPGKSTPSRRRRRATGQAPSFDDMKRKFSAQPGDKPWSCTWPETMLEIFIYPQQNASLFKSLSNSVPPVSSPVAASATVPPSPTMAGNLPFPSGFPGSFMGDAARSSGTPSPSSLPTVPFDEFPPLQPPYPRVVKLEERRLQGSPAPVCRQLKIDADGKASPNLDANGKPIEIVIAEIGNTPPYRGDLVARGLEQTIDEHLLFRRDSSDISDCGCVWFST